MKFRVLVLGGYGNFGKRISHALAGVDGLQVIVAGRNARKASELAQLLGANVESASLDIGSTQFGDRLRQLQARLVIHACGPFQQRNYDIAAACIAAGVHYVDLADDRRFVADIESLDGDAQAQRVLIVSGASSVPGLSSAVVDEYLPRFGALNEIRIAIAPGNRAERGEATVGSIMSYTGQPFTRWERSRWVRVFGWQDIHVYDFPPPVGRRWLANCDIPDLQLFPQRYPGVATVTFHAGLELGILHLGTWAMSVLARVRIVKSWMPYTRQITRMARWFEFFGSDAGAMFVILRGTDHDGAPLTLRWTLLAEEGHGPEIPSIAAIVLAKKLAAGTLQAVGAKPCMGFFTLAEFMHELRAWNVRYQLDALP